VAAIAIVPARLASTRLPRKPLLRETGKYLIEHVVEQVRLARSITRVAVATDSLEVEAACATFGAECVLTSGSHPSGTDRCQEAYTILAARGERAELVVNVQGDEPEIDPGHIDRLVGLMRDTGAEMGTLAEPLVDAAEAAREQVVKVVLDDGGRCLYFSRAAIPSGPGARVSGGGGAPPSNGWLRHVGIYAFRPGFLATFTRLPPSALERRERLEQLRALSNGHAIHAAIVQGKGVRGIDTPEDYAAFVARFQRRTAPSTSP
jgi:3-deoxy-manno-octulosonate cytidylyltransferase (CMP-KDO synthetase)